MMEIKIQPLGENNWAGFISLMSTDVQCSECWCLNHREPAGCATGLPAQEKMKELVSIGKVHGLLAYQNEECVGWIAIDPMSALKGHDCQTTGKVDEWSIHCIFIKDGFRGMGLSKQLIKAAIEYAKLKGATLISAFPIPEENRNKFPANEAEFSGRFSTYSKMGFEPVGKASSFYQRMEHLI